MFLYRYMNFSDSVIKNTKDFELDLELIKLMEFFKIEKSGIVANDIIGHDIWI